MADRGNSRGGGRKKKEDLTIKVVLGPCRLSFPHLFTPQETDNGDRYQANFLFPPNWTKQPDYKKFQDALYDVMEDMFGKEDDWPRGRNDRGPKEVVRDADEKDYEGYKKGWYFIKAASRDPVGIVDANREEVTNEREVYGGRWCRISVTVKAYDNKSRGVGVYLNSVQVLDHDEQFGGRGPAKNDFEDWDGPSLSDDDRGTGRGHARDDRDRDDDRRGSGRDRDDRNSGRGSDRDDRSRDRDDRGGRDRDRGRRSDSRDDDRSRSRDRDDRSRDDDRGGRGSRDTRDDDRGGRDRDRDRGRDRDRDSRDDDRGGRDRDDRGGRDRDDRGSRSDDDDRRPSRSRDRGDDDRGRSDDRDADDGDRRPSRSRDRDGDDSRSGDRDWN